MNKFLVLFSKQVFLYGVFSAIIFGVFVSVIFIALPSQQYISKENEGTNFSPVVTAESWGVFDVRTGEVIEGKNIDHVRPIASITKLFTGEVVLMSAHKDDVFQVEHADVNTEGRAGKLVYGESVSPYELLYPLLLESSNDAGHAIKRYLGIEYATTISSITESLHLDNTKIYDGSGLSPQNVSTVRELARYYAHLKRDEPHLLDITQVDTFITDNTGYVNNNPGRAFDSFNGGKHGFTDEAERTFVGSFTEHSSRGEIGIVLLGSADLTNDIQELQRFGESIRDGSDIMAQ
jgi:D-alanyl-D-alanine carboxypeptidase